VNNKKVLLSVLSTAVVSSIFTPVQAQEDLSTGIYIGGDIDKYYSFADFIKQKATAKGEITQAGFGQVLYVTAKGAAVLKDFIKDRNNAFQEPSSDLLDDIGYDDGSIVTPELLEATATDSTTVELQFDVELTEEQVPEAEDIVITDADGNELTVEDVQLSEDDPSIVVVTTAEQEAGVEYTLTFGDAELKFDGFDPEEPALPAVESVSAVNGTVTVVFDQELEAAPAAADLVVKQSINGAATTTVTASAITLGADKKTVTVTVPEVAKAAEKQSVVYSVSYKSGAEKAAAAFEVEALPVALAVESVSATNSKTLEVKFNKEVDPTKVTFTTTRDGNPVVLTATVSADKKSATLSSDSALLTGTYVVTASGETFAEGKNSATVDIAAEKVSKIEFTSDKLVKTANDVATVGYKVYNQYNEDITTSALAANLQYISSVAQDTLSDDNAGVITLDASSNFTADQKIVITAIDATSGVTVSKSLTVADAAALDSFALGTLRYPTDKTRVETGSAAAAYLGVDAKDQYGNAVTSPVTLGNAIQLISSDSNVTLSFDTLDSKPVIKVNTAALATAKKVVITAVVKATGATTQYTVDVVNPPAAAEVAVAAPTAVIAAGDTAGSLVAGLTVKDQFGGTLTTDEIVAQASDLTITSSNSSVIASSDLAIATSGGNKGKIVSTGAIGAAGTTTITVTVNATGKSSSFTVEAKAARSLSTLSLPTTLATNLIQGAETTFALSYKDQYGADFTPSTNSALKVNLSVTKVSGDDNGVTLSPTGDVADERTLDDADAITLTAVAGKTGTYNVVAKLVNASNEVISQSSKQVKVVANSSANLTYSVDDVTKLYKNGADFNTADVIEADDVAEGYAQEIKVSAKDAAGNSYVIPASAIVSVSVDGSDAVVGKIGTKWYVAGNDTTTITADTVANLTIVVNTNEGIKTINKAVTISKDALIAQEVKLLNADIADEAATAVTSLTFADNTELFAGKDVYAYIIDQFGGHSMTFSGSEFVTNNSGFTFPDVADKFSITGGKLVLVDGNTNVTATANAKARYVFVTSNGKTAAIDVTVTTGF